MKSPVDVVKGRIVDVSDSGELTIKVNYGDFATLIRREYKECNVQLIDSRSLSDKQRKMCYALLREISEYTGMGLDPTKQWMKLKYIAEDLQETADQIFSLSNAPMSLVCGFQRFLVRFILDWEIPVSFPLLEYVDDVDDYIYACLIHKKCCICGQPSDLHHVDRVGMRSRDEIIHEGMRVMPLCRVHHTEAHTIDSEKFKRDYHLTDGIVLDKTLCRIYRLKTNKKVEEDTEDA